MANLRIGIVGAGGGVGSSRGMSYARVIKALGEQAAVTGMCDIVREYADARAAEVGAKPYYDYEAMLEDVDVVVVATPVQVHAEQAAKALEHGVHVISEVTACHSLEAAKRLAEASRRSQAIYMMAENYRYLDSVELLKRMADDGRFGDLYYGEGEYLHDCRDLTRNADGSLTWRGKPWTYIYCTHSLGPLLYITGDRPARVTAMDTGVPSRTDPEIQQSEMNCFLCKTVGGSLLRIRVDWRSQRPHKMDYYALQGTRGAYEAWRGLGDQDKVWLGDAHEESHCSVGANWHPLSEHAERYIPERLAVGKEARLGGHGTSEYWLLKDFFAAVRGERESPIDVYRALDYTVPGILAYQSARRGGEPLDMPDFRQIS